jgi:hypothetical protein
VKQFSFVLAISAAMMTTFIAGCAGGGNNAPSAAAAAPQAPTASGLRPQSVSNPPVVYINTGTSESVTWYCTLCGQITSNDYLIWSVAKQGQYVTATIPTTGGSSNQGIVVHLQASSQIPNGSVGDSITFNVLDASYTPAFENTATMPIVIQTRYSACPGGYCPRR